MKLRKRKYWVTNKVPVLKKDDYAPLVSRGPPYRWLWKTLHSFIYFLLLLHHFRVLQTQISRM